MSNKEAEMSEKTKKENLKKATRKVSWLERALSVLFYGESALKDDFYSGERVKDTKKKQR
ncbi:MAG: hypothetical protein IKK76_02555 [Alphaproteobacteria bacterium]|nr:hypothetical protein [Alphaproteobacteria bacterium]